MDPNLNHYSIPSVPSVILTIALLTIKVTVLLKTMSLLDYNDKNGEQSIVEQNYDKQNGIDKTLNFNIKEEKKNYLLYFVILFRNISNFYLCY